MKTTTKPTKISPSPKVPGETYSIRSQVEKLVQLHLRTKDSSLTRIAYQADLETFAEWFVKTHPNEKFLGDPVHYAVYRLIANEGAAGNRLGNQFLFALKSRKPRYAPHTINRRMTSLASLVRTANHLGLVNWTLTFKREKSRVFKKIVGPSKEEINTLFTYLYAIKGGIGIRDRCIFHLLFDLGLRRLELSQLYLRDAKVNDKDPHLLVKAKGHLPGQEKERIPLIGVTLDRLKDWIDYRGRRDGPLFYSLTSGGDLNFTKLSYASIQTLIKRHGARIGLKNLGSHKIRHSSATIALSVPGRSLTEVAMHTRNTEQVLQKHYLDRINETEIRKSIIAEIQYKPVP